MQSNRTTVWAALVSAAASVLLHTAHVAAVLSAVGASGLQAHAQHAHGGDPGPVTDWLAWLGWGANGLTLLLAAGLFISFWRLRRKNRRKAASHLIVCVLSFAVVTVTVLVTL